MKPAVILRATVAMLVVPTMAACGFNAQTDQVYTPSRGTNDRSGSVDVLNAVVVSGGAGSGTVSATLVNSEVDQPDVLTGVTVEGQPAVIKGGGKAAALGPGGALNLSASGAVTAEGDAIVPGDFVELTFTFQHGDKVTLQAPVVPNTGAFSDVKVPEAG